MTASGSPDVTTDARGDTTVQIGPVRLHLLTEIEHLAVDADEFFPDRPGGDGGWCLEHPFRDRSTGRFVLTIRAYLAVLPDRVVLIDCGVGNGKSRARPEFDRLDTAWPDALAATGVTPDDVDTVVLTHLHVDHVGWATRWDGREWTPTFRNATHVVSATELAHWRGAAGAAAMRRTGDYVADCIDPLAAGGLLSTADPASVLPDQIDVRELPGHTPGNRIVRIADGPADAVLCGDVVHHPIQCAHPRINSRYCCDAGGAVTARERVLSAVADRPTLLLPSHFPGSGVGRVTRDGDGFRWTDVTAGGAR